MIAPKEYIEHIPNLPYFESSTRKDSGRIFQESPFEIVRTSKLWDLFHLPTETKYFEVEVDAGLSVRIPDYLLLLRSAILQSKYILNLKDGWDDEGSVGYTKETWIKAIKFLLRYGDWIHSSLNSSIFAPFIFHGKNGGIDLLWEQKSFRILIRLDREVQKGVFYADNLKDQTSEGEFLVEVVNFCLLPAPLIQDKFQIRPL